jgi:hypothetical protein
LSAKDGGFGELDNPQIQPDAIIFMCGINNVGHTDEPVVDKIVAGDLAAVKRLHELRPNAYILVQSILPTNNPGDVERFVKPINAKLAAELRKLGPKIGWLDLFPSFVRADGLQDPSLFRDGYHPTIKGYQVWRARLLPALAEIRKTGTVASAPAGDIRSRIINTPTVLKAWGTQAEWRTDKGVPGGGALRISLTGKEKNLYDVGVYSPIDKPVKAGDRLILAYWGRVERAPDGGGTVNLTYNAIQLTTAPFTQVVRGDATLTSKWEVHKIIGVADRDYAATEIAAAIQLAAGRQVIDIGPVFVYDLGQ